MKTFKTLIGVSICLAVAGIALANVTFDPATGTGFVGKGDVQTAFGWNNAMAQANASGVTFTYKASTTYTVTEEWFTLEGGKLNKSLKTHQITQTKMTSINATIQYDARTHKQIDGFILTGFGSTSTTGDPVPNVGDVTVDRALDRANPNAGQWYNDLTDTLWGDTGTPDLTESGWVQYPTDTVVTAVTLDSSSGGGLYVNYGLLSVLLWPPAPVPIP